MERDDEKERGKQRARQVQSERMHGPESRQQAQLVDGESKSDAREREMREGAANVFEGLPPRAALDWSAFQPLKRRTQSSRVHLKSEHRPAPPLSPARIPLRPRPALHPRPARHTHHAAQKAGQQA